MQLLSFFVLVQQKGAWVPPQAISKLVAIVINASCIAMTIGSLVYSGGDSVVIMLGPISAGLGAIMVVIG